MKSELLHTKVNNGNLQEKNHPKNIIKLNLIGNN